jgi:two-component system, NtrC family, sensor kinase
VGISKEQARPGPLNNQAFGHLKRLFLGVLVALGLALVMAFAFSFSAILFSELPTFNTLAIAGSFLIAGVMILILWVTMNRVLNGLHACTRELEELKSQLYHAHKMVSVGTLAGEVVHEINNPLAIIDSQSGLIRDMLDPSLGLNASPEALGKELDEIDKAVRRGRGITHKILSFVRKTEPRMEECDLNQLLDEVASMKGKEFEVSDIRVEKEYDDLPKVLIDPDLLQQVFLNLLNNAGDAVGRNGTITLKTTTRDGTVRISISDTGIGMTPETVEQSFKPFFTTKKGGRGTGLGLPICVNIVEGFGGRIEVESTPGVGTEFTVVLPAPQ